MANIGESLVVSAASISLVLACAAGGVSTARGTGGTSEPAPRTSEPELPRAPDAGHGGVPAKPAAEPAIEPTVRSDLSRVLEAPYPDLDWSVFDDGALLSARSLLVVVKGEKVVQKPEWLAGLPEWVNWDASTYVALPLAREVPAPELPVGTAFSAHAGNRHGPDAELFFDGKRFGPQRPARDPRLAKLPKATGYVQDDVLAFPGGGLIVVRSGGEETSAFLFAKGHPTPTRSVIPAGEVGYRRSLVGTSEKDVTFCDGSDSAWHWDGTSWSEIRLQARALACAVTRDGTLFVVTDSPDAELVRREADGFHGVALPDGLVPTGVAAGGDRLFVKAAPTGRTETIVLSNRAVSSPVVVTEDALPAPVFIDGITGLDVTSVDVISVSGAPAAPGTAACSSLVVWLGSSLTPEVQNALGASAPRLVEVSGAMPGQVVLASASGAQMRVQPSGRRKPGVAAVVASYAEGRATLRSVATLVPEARLLCAKPRVTRELK